MFQRIRALATTTTTKAPNHFTWLSTHLHDVRIEVGLGAHAGAVHQRPVLGLVHHIEQLFLGYRQRNAAGQLRHVDRLHRTGHVLDGIGMGLGWWGAEIIILCTPRSVHVVGMLELRCSWDSGSGVIYSRDRLMYIYALHSRRGVVFVRLEAADNVPCVCVLVHVLRTTRTGQPEWIDNNASQEWATTSAMFFFSAMCVVAVIFGALARICTLVHMWTKYKQYICVLEYDDQPALARALNRSKLLVSSKWIIFIFFTIRMYLDSWCLRNVWWDKWQLLFGHSTISYSNDNWFSNKNYT